MKTLIRILWFVLCAELPVLPLSCATVAYGQNQPVVWRTNLAAAKAEARQSGKPLLAFCTQSGCSPCQRMEESVWPRMAGDLASVVAVKVQPGADMAALGVSSTPTTILWDAGGKEKAKYIGYTDRVTLALQLASLPLPSPSAKVVTPDYRASVLRIKSHGASGTVIKTSPNKSWILSCAHMFLDEYGRQSESLRKKPFVIDGPPQAAITTPGLARLVTWDYEADLSLIEIDQGPLAYTPVAPEGFDPGTDRVESIGYDKMTWPVTDATANVIATMGAMTFTMERPIPGRSGGALIDVDKKLLIGVVQGYEIKPPSRGLYVSNVVMTNFLRKIFQPSQPKSAPTPKGPNYFPPPQTLPPPEIATPVPLPPVADHRIDELSERLDRYKEALLIIIRKDQDGTLKGDRGEPGPAGLIGPAGPQGPPGAPGKDADVSALRAELDRLKADQAKLKNVVDTFKGSIHVKVSQ